MKERAKLKYEGKSYMDRDLLSIGNNVATLWGASCYGYKIDRMHKKVYFECIEHGEKFLAPLDFDKLSYHS